MVNTDSPTFTVKWVIFATKIVSRFFKIAVTRRGFGNAISFRDANNVKFVDRNVC